jgi:hypothetical protein
LGESWTPVQKLDDNIISLKYVEKNSLMLYEQYYLHGKLVPSMLKAGTGSTSVLFPARFAIC